MPTPKRISAFSKAMKEAQTAEQPDSQPFEQQNIQPASHSDSQTAKQQQRIKATFYLEPDDIIAIDEMQIARFRATGKKPEKSQVVSEAIKSLFKHQNG
jgi:hypothetical protein